MKSERKRTGRKQTVHILIAALMSIFCFAGTCAIPLLGQTCTKEVYLQMLFTVSGMIFSALLFVFCHFITRENFRPGNVFTAVPVFLFLAFLLSGTLDLLNGTPELKRILFILAMSIEVSSLIVHALLGVYQSASLPPNRVQQHFNRWFFFVVLLYFSLLITNPFTHLLFYIDENGWLVYPGELIEVTFFTVFYLTYVAYVLPQKCSLRKKISLSSSAFFPI
ncbi:MAG: hypothetical protein MJ078_05075, partial [Clostridia bacterium]|nr:hypothetical protein [Clostridia bacterium]